MKILARQIPVNTPDNVVYYESVLDRAMSVESGKWLQVGQRGAYVRRHRTLPQVALRFDFLLDLAPDLAIALGQQRQFVKLCKELALGKPARIRVGEDAQDQVRVVVLARSFLGKLIDMKKKSPKKLDTDVPEPAPGVVDPERVAGMGDAYEGPDHGETT